MKRFEPHSHTWYSNLRLLDCINNPKRLIDRAIELGLGGIAITDHECLSAAPEVSFYGEEIQKEHPDFKVALGNEIYLCGDRRSGQKYYHFILIAKNKDGWRALRELSSRAWMNMFEDRRMERVVTTYDDLIDIMQKYPKSLIATSACLGGELSSNVAQMIAAEKSHDDVKKAEYHDRIVYFLMFCQKLFGEDFYIECAPGCSKDQISVNQRLVSIAKVFNIPMVIGTDSHYLSVSDRFIHKAYLTSKDGEREVDNFYDYSYLQSDEEIREHLKASNFDDLFIDEMYQNSMNIYDKIETFSIHHKQTIPKVEVTDYRRGNRAGDDNYPVLKEMLWSTDKVERYWVNECLNKLETLGKLNDTYLSRLEEEAATKKIISEKLETNMFSYPVTLQHYIDLFWECGSLVGAGRGSSCSGLNHYLLGVTQLDPIQWDLPWFRYLNPERVELGDIDIDLCPSKRPLILQKIKEERGSKFNADVDAQSRKNLGCSLIATFGTEGTKSAILTACRGYRGQNGNDSEETIDVDEARYMASLIPSERGFLWPLSDVINGNPEKGREPIYTFINEVSNYPGLLDIMLGIEGIVNKRSSHASGVIMFDEDPYEFGSFMRTPAGEIITSFDLHMCEALGMTKYDFLVTEVCDKIVECLKFLQKDNLIPSNLPLREVYNKYLHPSVLPIEDQECWKALRENRVLSCFQFDSEVGAQAAKKIRPQNILEMADANGLMRLMPDVKGAETPMEKYIRFKRNIMLWYDEMDKAGLTKEEQKILEPYFKSSYGVPPSQEQLMRMLMDENICGFTLGEANTARKIVGKKQMNKIPALKEKVLTQAKSPSLGQYVWSYGVGPQMGYSFSIIHALAYSFIGYQTVYLATHWNPIYWNTSCLLVNSASIEEDSMDDDEESNSKEKGADYAKMAKALGEILSRQIAVSLIDINKSDYSFTPDAANNQILFGLKALSGINSSVIEKIVANRPYNSIKDFMKKCPLNKTAMVALIKSGAFDTLDGSWAEKICPNEPRKAIMAYYLSYVSDTKKKLTLSNFNGLLQKGLIPEYMDFEKRVFNFNKYLKLFAFTSNGKKYYRFDDVAMNFYSQNFDMDVIELDAEGQYISDKYWDKQYKNVMAAVKEWLAEYEDEVLDELNGMALKETWDKYANGTISAWEMESMCFYYHKHELAEVNNLQYGINNFFALNSIPEVDYYYERGKNKIPIYKLYKIAGTVISKNDTRASISLLTTTGVVNVKFTKEYYAMFKRQLSEIQDDGHKKTIEKGWFSRGTKLLITGFRRDDTFVAKTYANTPTHTLYKIIEVNGKEIVLESERANN